MADEIVIKVDGVSKTFKLPHEKQSSLKSLFVNVFRRSRTYEKQKVLKDISFEVKKGEFFGIVGRNGSGKSTMLKLLAGIYSPDKGHVHINGKLTPFIELGVGFNPELTGRENVFLNGALLGFGRKEIKAMYDEIVEFAELHKFMDQKLKNYSSGMQVRLAFSIAIRANSDILLLDEVLAVGDAVFQKKCFDYFRELKRNKRTVVFISHDMEAIRKYCTKAILIENGEIVSRGSASEVSDIYINKYLQSEALEKDKPDFKAENSPIKLQLFNLRDEKTNIFEYGDEMKVKIVWKQNQDVKNVGFGITKEDVLIFGTNTLYGGFGNSKKSITLKIRNTLNYGEYKIIAGLWGDTINDNIYLMNDGPSFIIKKSTTLNFKHPKDKLDSWGGIVYLENEWTEQR